LNIKLKFNLFSGIYSIDYKETPLTTIKAVMSPGVAELKEKVVPEKLMTLKLAGTDTGRMLTVVVIVVI
jgi:hypothetical protein